MRPLLDEETLEAAAANLASVGYAVFRGAVPVEPLTRLRRRMDRDSIDLMRYLEMRGGNPRARGHLQQGPPVFRDYVIPEVSANPIAIQVCTAVLGKNPYYSFYNGNTNYPGSTRQHLHLDSPHITEPGEAVGPTYALVVNIPPGPCTLGNGAIEIWPGTHRLPGGYPNQSVPEHAQDLRRVEYPPIQVETEPGDMLIRDIRLWHRGVPNASNRPRHMIAIVVSAPWRERRARLTFGAGCEAALCGRGFDPNAEFVSGAIDYLYGPSKAIFERQAAGPRTQ